MNDFFNAIKYYQYFVSSCIITFYKMLVLVAVLQNLNGIYYSLVRLFYYQIFSYYFFILNLFISINDFFCLKVAYLPVIYCAQDLLPDEILLLFTVIYMYLLVCFSQNDLNYNHMYKQIILLSSISHLTMTIIDLCSITYTL